MSVINIIAFFICLFALAYFWKESLADVFPALTCMLVLMLYGLAFLHRLNWIDGIGVLVIVLFGVWLVRSEQSRRESFGKTCLQNMTQTSFIISVALLIAVILCTSGKVVTWWDDINFWATDVKSLYYLNGFAGKYGNVAPEFGDYPPGGQMIKWWFLHFNPDGFREGLAFAGYYCMNLVFMLPLLRKIRGRNILLMGGMAIALWLLPGIAEVYGYDGFCADLTLACIYGGFLYAVIDREGKKESFYYARLALYLSVLVLVKSVGFIWALFGIVFFLAYQYRMGGREVPTAGQEREGQSASAAVKKREGQSASAAVKEREGQSVSAAGKSSGKQSAEPVGKAKDRLKAFLVCAAPVVAGGSWMLFCLLMRRVTKTTTTAVKYMTTDEYGISGYTGDFARAFLEAFVSLPLHKKRTFGLDLTPLSFYLCICLLVIFFYRKKLMPKKQGRLVLWFSILSGALFYGIIFIAHITIFATETQYLEASGMISSIERYGAPFTIGTLLFLAHIWMNCGAGLFAAPEDGRPGRDREQSVKEPHGDEGTSAREPHWDREESVKEPWYQRGFMAKYGVCLCFLLFVGLTADWRTGYHGLIGYRKEVPEQLTARAEMTDEDGALFLEKIKVLGTGESTRICYVQRDDEPKWVRNSYTNLAASPISVVYCAVNLDDAVPDWMAEQIRDSHASYLYVEQTDADTWKVFNNMTDDGTFSCEKLYRIEDDGTQMRLAELQFRQ